MSALGQMIEAQAGALEAVARLDVASSLGPLASASSVALVGTGTSLHAAELGAFLLRGHGLRARAVAAADCARWDAPQPGEAAILISHTGETAFAVRSRRQLLDAGNPLVSITGPGSDWPEAIRTPVQEQSDTYTVSYTCALAVLGMIASELAGAPTGAVAIREVAEHVSRVIQHPGIDDVAVPARSMAIVGVGPWAVTAREGALKIREAARMLCDGLDVERLLHGAAVPYGPADGLCLLEPSADPDGLLAAFGTAAAAASIPVSVITDENRPSSSFLAQIPMTVRLQCLAGRLARLRRIDPDRAISGTWMESELWHIGLP
jgi:glutamine---fructose-6-phosphate transaminase (isomerizing)